MRRALVAAPVVLATFLLAGCGSSDEPPQSDGSANAATNAAPKTSRAGKDAGPAAAPKADPAQVWAKLSKEIEAQLADGDAVAAAESFAALEEVYGDAGPPAGEQQAQLERLQSELQARQRAAAHRQRDEQLQAGQALMDQGQFDESIRQIEAALARSPTDEQRQLATQLKQEIEYRRKTQRSLSALRKLLGSEVASEVQSAQLQLRKEPDTAMPLLTEWSQRAEEPRLVANALETMRRIKRPALALPAMLGVLSRVEQQANWNDAVSAIAATESAGIGPDLLKLAAESDHPQQRAAALEALAQVPDPPGETLATLLPLILEDGPELTPALRAAGSAVVIHGQYDLAARRGIETPLTAAQQQQMAALPDRLAALIARGEESQGDETARAAAILAVATRQIAAEPLTGVKVASAGAESELGRKEAVLDGVWNSVELETMWYHPIAQPGMIILDLGAEKTVVGVRVWNFNQPAGTHRGWKETDVYVSNITSELTPTTSGIIPPAPGIEDPPDYSTIIPVDFVRGRYVKLKAKSVWSPDAHMGLSEIQVLGF